MKLTLQKTYKGQIVDVEEYEISDIYAYMSLLASKGLEIEPDTAEYDMQQPDVRYRVPITPNEIN